MTIEEANALYAVISDESSLRPDIRPINDGREYVLREGNVHIWNRDDWDTIKDEFFSSRMYAPVKAKKQ